MTGSGATWTTRLDEGSGGLRVAVKDLFDVAGVPTTAGSRAVARDARPALRDAACLKELRAAVGAGTAVLVGKTNLDELGLGISGVNPWFGTPVNPTDPRRVPGGSSSGSAAAVGHRDADVAVGTDTSGSVRIPAACCGVVGLTTTWGRIPLEGVWPLAPSLDTVGLLARDTAGLTLAMALLDPSLVPPVTSAAPSAGTGPGAPTGTPTGAPNRTPPGAPNRTPGSASASVPAGPVGRLRARAPDGRPMAASPAVEAALDAALAAAELEVVDVVVPGWLDAAQAALHILGAEAAALHRHRVQGGTGAWGPGVVEALGRGARTGHQRLLGARNLARRWRARLEGEVLGQVTALALPVLDGPAPFLDSDLEASLTVRWTAPVNLAGLPAVALPVSLPADATIRDAGQRRSGPPVPGSLQLVGPAGSERRLVGLAALIEAAGR